MRTQTAEPTPSAPDEPSQAREGLRWIPGVGWVDGKHVLRPRVAGRYIGRAASTLAKDRLSGCGPKFVKLSARAVGYRVEDLDAWVERRVRSSTSDDGRRPSTAA
jgi:hypothetical protein